MRPTLLDTESIRNHLTAISNRRIDAAVVESIAEINTVDGRLPDSKVNVLKELGGDSPLVIVTGQQVGLFGGPVAYAL